MNLKERQTLIQWAKDEEMFLDEIISRCKLHRKILNDRVKQILRKRND